ncbi:transferase, Chloramphenicol acetyltransferase-like domain protein [Artemisia annua]|uniref:Transferase, Chloramphenicol acetyltransferase-like domain protein n=1 Tax=Artemisia annua TaxID=35608 RepID=A0A2U1NHC0_ARTAN|nr:transferase, Chloramphenicol acetyltransferase-like domain protein [Artemisia annua]
MEIKIRSIQIIKPSKPTPENQRSFKLSLFDQLAAFSNIDLILYYKSSCEVNITDRRSQLVNSLSEVLTSYYPLAGRIKEDGLEVDCCDQGVKYLETRVTMTHDSFLKEGPRIDDIR